ncbi:hypothetical protein OHA84_35435 [Streptomyces sp. NBC_00513]|uniref:hypothetical protein n=1 Tax=unclassified Streptomyces TaxID=2593676 RepID=UPI00224E0619|nr:hypothetical protein [Streptomyces sp. NBC_00424]MCX5071194.1 hypothetical protein [Streptomyces sp. NBC_00424]WUD45390.1 hypothetical protein OHA84_35435 [Streptomyces sp. NBC_00513]
MNHSTARRALSAAGVSVTVLGALMVAAVATPFFLKSSFKMSSESASTAWTSIMAGMDVASAIGLVTGGLAIGSVLIWTAKQAIKKGGRKAFIA